MTDKSTRMTGNDPVEGADPGGTRSMRLGNADKSGATSKPKDVKLEQTVRSVDGNVKP